MLNVFKCKVISRRLSESLDRPLSLPERIALRIHLRFCPPCTSYRKQLDFMHSASARADDNLPRNQDQSLGDEARERLKQKLGPQ